MTEFDDNYVDTEGTEKLSTGERLKLARKKRTQQLKKYGQYEKQLEKDGGRKVKKTAAATTKRSGRVRFGENIVLLEAASRNDIEEVRSLLSSGVDPNVGNEDGLTALHQCCIDNLEEMLRLLVEFGASVNSCDSELWTPLHAAATCGHAQLCRYLVEQGADLLSVNGDGNMPFDICEHETALDYIESEMAKRGVTQDLINETRHIPEKKMLADLRMRLENESSLEFRGRNGETPLHVSATNGYIEATKFLLDQRVSVNVTDNDLWQPIHCAAFWCQVPLAEILMKHGASLDVRTRSGESPFDICDDGDTKKRLLELKKEFEGTRRSFKSRALSRDRNSSFRRGSVRRSSMKEKKALSLKASREEGRWLQDAAMQNEEDEDDPTSSNERVAPENHLPNSSSGTPRSSRYTAAPTPVDGSFPSPSQKPLPISGTPSGIRKGTRLPAAKEDSTELDQRNVHSPEDLEKRSEIKTLLIPGEKCNGSKDVELGVEFSPGIARSQRGCCAGQCCLLQ